MEALDSMTARWVVGLGFVCHGTIAHFYLYQTGELIQDVQAHEPDFLITDMQMATDRTYFITACKDKTAKILSVDNLKVLKTYTTDTPLNTATITSKKDFVILGGGQEARDVTTTSSRQGKFEARFYHKIFESEIGRVKVSTHIPSTP